MSVRQRLYPDPAQVVALGEHCAHVRFLYNLGLEQRSMWRRDKHVRGPERSAPRVSVVSQQKELAHLRAEYPWLGAGSSSIQQGALRDLDRAFTNFFAGRAGYPQFKSRRDQVGFVVRDLMVRRVGRRWGLVHVPKVGYVKFRLTRSWTAVRDATSARVTHRNGYWHVAFTTDPPATITAGTGAVVGIDRGIANTIATSDGHLATLPSLTPGEQARFLALERRLARQTRAAKAVAKPLREARNRAKTLSALAALRATLDFRRTNWIEQQTTALARGYDTIVLEALPVRNMVRAPKPKPDPANPGTYLPNGAAAKAALNRLILASWWGEFARRLTDKTPPGAVVFVDARYTSQACPRCHQVAKENRKSQAVFRCVNPACGYAAHADTNAAENILTRGLHQPEDIGGSPAQATTPPCRRNQPHPGKEQPDDHRTPRKPRP